MTSPEGSSGPVDGLNLYPTGARKITDKLLLESISKVLESSPSRVISWSDVTSALSKHIGEPVNTWSVKAKFHELNSIYCMIRAVCQSNEFQWDASKCEVQASDNMWQELTDKQPSFAAIQGLHFPVYETLSKVERIYESGPLNSSLRRDASDAFAQRQKRLSGHSRLSKSQSGKSVDEDKNASSSFCSSPKSDKVIKVSQKKLKHNRRRSSISNVKMEEMSLSWTPDKDRLLIEQAVFHFQTGEKSSAWPAILDDWNDSFRIRGKADALFERYHTLRNTYLVILQLEKFPGMTWDSSSCTLTCSMKVDEHSLMNELSSPSKLSEALEWILRELNRNSSFTFPLFYEIQNLHNLILRSTRKRRKSFGNDRKDCKFQRKSSDTDVKGSRDSWTEAVEVFFADELCKSPSKNQDGGIATDLSTMIELLSQKFRISFSESFLRQKLAFLHRKYRHWRKIIRFKEVTWDPDECKILAPDAFWDQLREDKQHFQLYGLFRYSKFSSAPYLDRFFSSDGDSDSETLSMSCLKEDGCKINLER